VQNLEAGASSLRARARFGVVKLGYEPRCLAIQRGRSGSRNREAAPVRPDKLYPARHGQSDALGALLSASVDFTARTKLYVGQ
jgi:hypothetical protein